MSTMAALVLVLDALERLEDLRLHGDVEGGRGLVGDDDVGVVAHRHGDHGPLAHAAGELVRVGVGPLLGVRDADEVEHLDGPVPRLLLRDVVVGEHRLGQLPADGVHGVHRRHRVLEDHGDLAARGSAFSSDGLRPTSSSPRNLIEPAHRGVSRQQAHDRHAT